MRFFLPVLLLTALFAVPSLAAPAKKIEPVQVWNGDGGSVQKPETSVAITQDQWLRLWQKTEQKTMIQPLLKGQMAVGVFSGTRTTSGYQVFIADIRDRDHKITVIYRLLKPSQTRLPAGPYQTSPWVIALFSYSDKPVVFQQEQYAALYYVKQFVRGIGDFFEGLLVKGFHGKPEAE